MNMFRKAAVWLSDLVGSGSGFMIFGQPTYSGKVVTPDNSLQVPAIWASMKILAETEAGLPFGVYERTPDGTQPASNHPVHELLHDAPNPEMSAMDFRMSQTAQLALWGNCYSRIARNSRDEVIALWPLQSRLMEVKRDNRNELTYKYNSKDEYASNEILHVRTLSFDGINGISPISQLSNPVGLAMALEEYASRFFGNGAIPAIALEHPKSLSPKSIENLRSSFKSLYGGLENAHEVAVAEEGMQIKVLGTDPQKSQSIESRRFQIGEIARIYRIPLHLLGDLERATFCLPAGSQVFTSTGPRPIEAIVPGEKVWSKNSAGEWIQSRVKHSVCTGEDEILTIRTTNRTIRANGRHRILVRRKYPTPQPGQGKYQISEWRSEYVPAAELKVGDTLVCLDKLPAKGSDQSPTRKVSKGFAAFCGLLLGDGIVNENHGITIARAANAEYMDQYRAIMREEFVCYDGGNGRNGNAMVAVRAIKLDEAERYTRFASVLASRELTALGLSGTAKTKRVPHWVFGLNEELRRAFLGGFLDADGSVDKLGRISFSSCNAAMLSQVRHLCMSCGIPVTNQRCQRGFTTLPNGKRARIEQWSFTCSDPGQNRRIESYDPRYRQRLSDGEPFFRKGRAYPRHGGKKFDLPGCGLSRISSITAGPAELVYDLEVEETHNFIAEGVMVHNSNIEQQSLEFVTYTLMPWLEIWEQAVNRSLFTSADRRRYFCEHNVAGLLRGDLDSRYRAYATGRQWGWLSVDDIRRLENMNAIGDAAGGGAYLVPLNMADAKWLANGALQPNKPGTPDPTGTLSPLDTEAAKATALKAAILALAAMSRN